MQDTQPPPPENPAETVLAEVLPLALPIYSLIEGGTQKARKFIDDECEGKNDPWLFPMIVRSHVCRGLDALAVGDITFSRRDIANDGIEVTYGKRTIKVWKLTPDGELPSDGGSAARIDFYNCNLFGDDPMLYRSLVVLWEIAGGTLKVQLVAPRAAGSRKDLNHQLWAIAVPHPATMMKVEPPVNHADDDLNYLERSDDKPSTQTGESEGEDE